MRTKLYVTARILPLSSHSTRWGQSAAIDQQEKIGIELTALREQATQELEAFSTPKRKRRTKAEIAAQE
jgi:hypothetical protein